MKTTIEISDQLLQRSRKAAQREGSTLRALIEEGLRLALQSRRRRKTGQVQFPVYGGSGLTDEFLNSGWERVRDEIYRDRGA